jgi:N-acetylmuramoyl-L-alanine amidase
MKRCALILIFLLFLPAAVCADSSGRAYERARDSYYRLQDSGQQKFYRHNWEKVVDQFVAANSVEPGGSRAADALFMAGKASYELYVISGLKDDARRAAAYLDRLPDSYPKSSLADDALELSAKIHETILDAPVPAYRRYQRIVRDYPSGDMLARARGKVSVLARYAPPEPAPVTSAVPAAASGSQLRSIRFWSNPGYTRIVLATGTPTKFTSNFLKGDSSAGRLPRIYVDLEQTQPVADLNRSYDVNDGLLQKIRAGQPDEKTTRVVLDVESFRDYKIVPYEEPFRIVIDIFGDSPKTVATAGAESNPAAEDTAPPAVVTPDEIAGLLAPAPKEAPLRVHVPESRAGQGLRRIVVDAGHGGKDPGAVGARGTREKDVALAIARILAQKLEKDLGCEVIMTRTGNTFLELEERTAIANKVGADLFISIHANASTNRKVFGIETFYLNFSKNDKAVEVVARENGTSLKQVGDLEMILLDLMANSKINESSRLAAEIQKSLVGHLGKRYKVKDLGVRQGPFYVLLGATMPSVLVETAFISNSSEEKLLTNTAYQNHTADAIVAAVRSYAISLNLMAAK